MTTEQHAALRLEIGHLLFIDIVAYSKLLINQQSELQRELNDIVSETNQFREADAEGKLIRLPRHGAGLPPEASAQCALEIGQARRTPPEMAMGSIAWRSSFPEDLAGPEPKTIY